MIDHTEYIEQYLNGLLNAEELAIFEQKLKDDTKFNTEFQGHKISLQALEFLNISKLKNQMTSWDQKQSKELKIRSIALKRKSSTWLLAASFLILASIGGVLLRQTYSIDNVLKDSYASMNPSVMRAEGPIISAAYAKAIDAYSHSNYTDCIKAIGTMTINDPSYIESRELLLDGYFQLGDEQNFTQSLAKIRNEHPSEEILLQKLDWLEVNLKLKVGAYHEAQDLLQQIANNQNHIFRVKANELQLTLAHPLRKLFN